MAKQQSEKTSNADPKKKINWPEILRFLVVGGVASILDVGGTALCTNVFGWPELIAKGICFFLGTVANYILCRLWVFKSQDDDIAAQTVKFFAINVVALLASVLMLWVYNTVLRLPAWLAATGNNLFPNLNATAETMKNVPNFLTPPIAALINYLGSKLWVFSAKKGQKAR